MDLNDSGSHVAYLLEEQSSALANEKMRTIHQYLLQTTARYLQLDPYSITRSLNDQLVSPE